MWSSIGVLNTLCCHLSTIFIQNITQFIIRAAYALRDGLDTRQLVRNEKIRGLLGQQGNSMRVVLDDWAEEDAVLAVLQDLVFILTQKHSAYDSLVRHELLEPLEVTDLFGDMKPVSCNFEAGVLHSSVFEFWVEVLEGFDEDGNLAGADDPALSTLLPRYLHVLTVISLLSDHLDLVSH